jgi:hypothetical protein
MHFQMGVFTPQQAAAAKLIAEVDKDYAWAKDFDWDGLSRGCEGQIEYSKSLATSDTFGKNLDALLAAAKKKLNNGYGLSLVLILIWALANNDVGPRSMSQAMPSSSEKTCQMIATRSPGRHGFTNWKTSGNRPRT